MSLLASAATLDAITEAVSRFYMGEVKYLEVEKDNTWTVHNPNGQQLLGVRVVKRGKRYRFEMVV